MPTTMPGHAEIDARSLALSRLVARRLREDPELIDVARRDLERWRQVCAAKVRATLAEWQAIVDGGLETTLAVLTGEDERSVRLRQSNPFAGEEIVTRVERNRLIQHFRR